MAAENQGNISKPSPKKLGKIDTKQKINPQAVVEQVPDWLKQLLSKYGEAPGTLIGLEEDSIPDIAGPLSAEMKEEGQLSALLQQMGEEGLEDSSTQRRATSVEWGLAGSATEELPSAHMDDLLSTLSGESDLDEQAPDWITGETDTDTGYQVSRPQAAPISQEETPDWLNEIIPTSTPSLPASPIEEEGPDEGIPDWLVDALNTSSPTGSEAMTGRAAQQQPPISAAEEEIPDWLNDAINTSPAAKPIPPASSGADEDVPDWLMSALDTSTELEHLAPSSVQPFASSVEDEDLPDWLSGSSVAYPPAEEESLTQAEEAEIPDWLSDLSGASALAEAEQETTTPDFVEDQTDSDIHVPDWLTEIAPEPADAPGSIAYPFETTEPAFVQDQPDMSGLESEEGDWQVPDWLRSDSAELPVDQDISDWLAETEGEQTDIPDWLTSQTNEDLMVTEATGEDWLSSFDMPPDDSATVAEKPTLPDLDDDWLAAFDTLPAAQETETMPAEDTSLSDDDWLANFDTPVTAAGAGLSTQVEPGAVPDTEQDDWLTGLYNLPATDQEPTAAAPDIDISEIAKVSPAIGDEFSPTEAADDESSASTGPRLKRLRSLSKASSEPASPPPVLPTVDEPEQANEESSDQSPAAPSTKGGAEPEMHDWLSSLRTANATAETPEVEAETPEWLANEDEVEVDIPDWLNELPDLSGGSPTVQAEVAETEEPGLAIPDWLADLPDVEEEPTTAQAQIEEVETPEWLAEEVETEMPDWLAGEAGAEMPEWLAGEAETAIPEPEAEMPEMGQEEPATTQVEVEETELPEWVADLSDLSTTSVTEAEVEQAEEDFEMPAWLAGLQPVHEEPAPVQAKMADEIIVEFELPEWLSELPDVGAESSITQPEPLHRIETETERPEWLVEQPEVGQTPPVAAKTEVETEIEMPDWLSGLPDAGEESAVAQVEAIDEAEVIDDIETEEADLVTPAWLAGLRTVGEETSVAQAEVEEAETEALPDWLAELPDIDESPATVQVEAAEAEAAIEAEMPDWRADLPDIGEEPMVAQAEVTDEVETEVEVPEWLADLSEAEETPAAQVEVAETQAETPDWFTDEAEAETVELEMPDWLADLPTVDEKPVTAQAETIEVEAEEEAPEMPAWLAGLRSLQEESITAQSEVEEVETETPGWLSDAAEGDMPDWLIEEIEAEEIPAAQVEVTETQAETETVELEMPDWLADLPKAEETPVVQVEVAETQAETPDWFIDEAEAETVELEMPDWLADLPTVDEKPVTAQAETIEVEAEEEAPEMPAWLAGLRSGRDEAVTAAAEVAETEAETQEWLADESEAEVEEAELEIPAWLSGLHSLQEMPAIDQTETIEIGHEAEVEIPEVGEAPITAQTEELEAEIEMPEWADEDSVTAEVETADEVQVEEELEMPGWLAGLRGLREETTAAEPEVEKVETETPDWLVDEVEVTADEAEAEAMPDWLADLPAIEEEEPTTGHVEVEEVETPTWLAGLPEVGEEEQVTAETKVIDEVEASEGLLSEVEAEVEEMPEWLAGLPAIEEEEPTTTQAKVEEADLEVPTWLAKEVDMGEEPAPAQAEEEALETPSWLAELPDVEQEPAPVQAEVEEPEDEIETPPWLVEAIEAEEEAAVAQTEVSEAEEDLAIPDWLFSKAEPGMPDRLAKETEAETAATGDTEVASIDEPMPSFEASALISEEAVDTGEELEIPSWLANTPFEEIEAPAWLADVSAQTEAGEVVSSSEIEEAIRTGPASTGAPTLKEEQSFTFDEEPEAPDWLAVPTDIAIDNRVFDSDAIREEKTSSAPAKEEPPSWLAGVSTTLESLKPAKKAPVEESSETAEATGMLAGLASFLPAEKVSTARAEGAEQDDNLLEAAREFYAIATQTPQPAVLPAPLTAREKLAGGVVRASLYLLFIVLVALPLLPGAQKEISGNPVPWTEPTGQWGEVLDNQRSQLISEQLGVIDIQPPESVALVSFDYSLATAGEMQPLAEAVVGRLLGQGMRVVAISLEPEGAAIAQETLNNILEKRQEGYGVTAVNLGYLPGQITAVRKLVIVPDSLAAIADYEQNFTFADPDRSTWAKIKGLDQVDLVVTLADNPVTARWWIEQLEAAPQPEGHERFLLAATSATAAPFLQPYRASEQLDGLISGINGAAAIEAVRNNFDLARKMIDSQSLAHLIIVILIAIGTMVGWMPSEPSTASATSNRRS